ncbi:MAG TPA: PfkB family carbohydrate kinase [Solirubrobacteraceae bacterium]|nr:PfkB family carbohydrate kinase [Solirubrobacteraceae bacterium]
MSAVSGTPRVAVVGHVEWMDFAVVDHVPRPGEIVHAAQTFEEAGGGGAVAAVQLRRLAGAAAFYTALGDDALAGRAREELATRHGLDVHAAVRRRAQRRGWTYLDAGHERTITVIGERLVPHGDDDLGWEELAATDAVYLTGGDAAAVRRARRARVLVATPRAADALGESGIELDVLVASANDADERAWAQRLDPPPRRVVLTSGAEGGRWTAAEGRTGTWEAVAPPGEPVDSYGCGDSFAAGLTFALGAGMALDDALRLAARCGAWCLTGRGPYGRQLDAAEL